MSVLFRCGWPHRNSYLAGMRLVAASRLNPGYNYEYNFQATYH